MLMLFLSLGCHKDNGVVDPQTEAFIQYRVNGQLVRIEGNLVPVNQSTDVGVISRRSQRGLFLNNFYQISGRNGSTNSIDLNIPGDSLETRSYYLNDSIYSQSAQAGVDIYHNDSVFRLQNSADFTNIIITSYQDGLISGTFTGAMSNYNPSANSFTQRTIVDGLFKNVKVYY